jgi:hypothetical protein
MNSHEQGDEHVLGFIDDPAKFIHIFDPSTMEYTGIRVSAKNVEDAKYIYENPTSELGEYTFCEEPKGTQAVRAIDNLQRNTRRAMIAMLVRNFVKINTDLTVSLSGMARSVYENSNKKMSPEDIFFLLKRNWAERFIKTSEYIDGP